VTGISPSEFGAFFQAIHGVEPFPWQRRLAEMVCTVGWPDAPLDVPTGAGKTAAIDVAVFHLAVEALRGPDRRAPVRIAFVVDRRLVVDDAYRRATQIAAALASPPNDIVRRVAGALGALAEKPSRPLLCARLRGGTPREPDWVRTPGQPTVVVSTVDQVGSRLLFRGYGVTDSMRPIHAGLLGIDTPPCARVVVASRWRPDGRRDRGRGAERPS
jgi:CRISPR-associated endonuclease/helicase Cas3